MHTAFVLAAGFGTRLRPLTNHVPKPLVPVCGIPMLAYALALCSRHGLTKVVVNSHWLAETLEPWAGSHEGVEVTISKEQPEILGTGGGLKLVAKQLADRFAIVNADVLSDVDLKALMSAVPDGGAAMALRSGPTDQYGVVAADSTAIVTKLVAVASAPASGEVALDTHFTGIHAMTRDSLKHVPDGFAGIVRTAYKQIVPQRLVGAIRHEGVWLDVGDPEAYLETNLIVLSGGVRLSIDPMPRAAWARSGDRSFGDAAKVVGAMIRKNAWIGNGATVDGATIENSVVGANATVPADTVLVDSVVWDGCTVPQGVHERVVIHPGGCLQI